MIPIVIIYIYITHDNNNNTDINTNGNNDGRGLKGSLVHRIVVTLALSVAFTSNNKKQQHKQRKHRLEGVCSVYCSALCFLLVLLFMCCLF